MTGTLHISERAVTKIVAAAVASVPGTLAHSTGFDRLTGRSYPRYDVQLDDDGDAVSIETFIAVTWPSPVLAVAEAVRSTVTQHVETYTGIPVIHVNVVVGPVVTVERRVARSDLDMPAPAITPVTAHPLAIRRLGRVPAPFPLRPITIHSRRSKLQ